MSPGGLLLFLEDGGQLRVATVTVVDALTSRKRRQAGSTDFSSDLFTSYLFPEGAVHPRGGSSFSPQSIPPGTIVT